MSDLVKFCHLTTSENTLVTYICQKNESCCKHGCCISTLQKVAEFWYFWLILIFICMIVAACTHYYRKLRAENELRNCNEHRILGRHVLCSRRIEDERGQLANRNVQLHRCVDAGGRELDRPEEMDEINEFFLEHFARRNQSPVMPNPPPDYESVEKDPIYTEPPPIYSEACKLLQENTEDLPAADDHYETCVVNGGSSRLVDVVRETTEATGSEENESSSNGVLQTAESKPL